MVNLSNKSRKLVLLLNANNLDLNISRQCIFPPFQPYVGWEGFTAQNSYHKACHVFLITYVMRVSVILYQPVPQVKGGLLKETNGFFKNLFEKV